MRNIVQEDADEIMEETNFDVETDEDDMCICGSVVIVILKTFQTESSHVEHVEKDHILSF